MKKNVLLKIAKELQKIMGFEGKEALNEEGSEKYLLKWVSEASQEFEKTDRKKISESTEDGLKELGLWPYELFDEEPPADEAEEQDEEEEEEDEAEEQDEEEEEEEEPELIDQVEDAESLKDLRDLVKWHDEFKPLRKSYGIIKDVEVLRKKMLALIVDEETEKKEEKEEPKKSSKRPAGKSEKKDDEEKSVKKSPAKKPVKEKTPSVYGTAVEIMCEDPSITMDELTKAVKKRGLSIENRNPITTAYSCVRKITNLLIENGWKKK